MSNCNNVGFRLSLPNAEALAKVDGQSLRVLLAVRYIGASGARNEVDLDELRILRMSRRRVLWSLEALDAAGLLRFSYTLGVITFKVGPAACVRTVSLDRRTAETLVSIGPAACKLWFLLTSHTGKDEMAFPSFRRLAQLMGRCRRTVQCALSMLIDLGLYVRQKVAWQKVPGFVWAATRRLPRRKKISVFIRTRTFAPNHAEPIRRVREHLKQEICLASMEKNQAAIVIDICQLPREIGDLATIGGGAEYDHKMMYQVRHLGFTSRAAAWIAMRCSREHMLIAFRRLLAGRMYIKDPKAYFLGCLRRLAAV